MANTELWAWYCPASCFLSPWRVWWHVMLRGHFVTTTALLTGDSTVVGRSYPSDARPSKKLPTVHWISHCSVWQILLPLQLCYWVQILPYLPYFFFFNYISLFLLFQLFQFFLFALLYPPPSTPSGYPTLLSTSMSHASVFFGYCIPYAVLYVPMSIL